MKLPLIGKRDRPRPVAHVDAAVLVAHVTRGNLACDVVLTAGAATLHPVGEITLGIVAEMLKVQEASPGRAEDPIVINEKPLALRARGADEPLDPGRPLLEQTEGHWRVEVVPVAGQAEGAGARLPLGAFELIDLEREQIVLH